MNSTPYFITAFQPGESEINDHFNMNGNLIKHLIKMHRARGDVMNCQGPLMMNIWFIITSSSACLRCKHKRNHNKEIPVIRGIGSNSKINITFCYKDPLLRWGEQSRQWESVERVWRQILLPLDFMTQSDSCDRIGFQNVGQPPSSLQVFM